MRLFRSARWLLLALLLSVVPASSFAGVFISVGFAPPMLPVYEQPPCPEDGLMWIPGYWAYGQDGYYWVPGAWEPAPYEGALWTPGYWGWSDGLYVFHDGYWGRHVGYYGGVNYGYGYGGVGFAGGEWREGRFAYNTAVMHVDNRYVHTTFMDRGRVDRSFVSRDSRVAFSGGPGGIRHEAGPEERLAGREQHMGGTQFQMQHENAARSDRGSYFRNNGGRPSTMAVPRAMGGQNNATPGANGGMRQGQQGSFGTNSGAGIQNQQRNNQNQMQQNQQFQPQNNQNQQRNQQFQPQNQQNQQRNQQFQPQNNQNQQRNQQFQQQNNQNQQRNQQFEPQNNQNQQRNQQFEPQNNQNQQRNSQPQSSRPAQQQQQSAPQQRQAAPQTHSAPAAHPGGESRPHQ
ncbi:MAG: hypothetical protein P4K94_03765 [Terracidiphilus sp.]|nr:hypothetical protein [Terracidiphilus sp.]